jgi:hypothetical protein
LEFGKEEALIWNRARPLLIIIIVIDPHTVVSPTCSGEEERLLAPFTPI